MSNPENDAFRPSPWEEIPGKEEREQQPKQENQAEKPLAAEEDSFNNGQDHNGVPFYQQRRSKTSPPTGEARNEHDWQQHNPPPPDPFRNAPPPFHGFHSSHAHSQRPYSSPPFHQHSSAPDMGSSFHGYDPYSPHSSPFSSPMHDDMFTKKSPFRSFIDRHFYGKNTFARRHPTRGFNWRQLLEKPWLIAILAVVLVALIALIYARPISTPKHENMPDPQQTHQAQLPAPGDLGVYTYQQLQALMEENADRLENSYFVVITPEKDGQ